MKIPENDPLHHLEISRPGTQGVSGGAAKDSSESGSSRSDKIDLSGQVQVIRDMKDSIASLPDIRADRIAEINNQIVSGTFQIQPEKIAENVVQAALRGEI